MTDSQSPPAASATGLFHSLSHFAGTLIGLLHTRLELLTTEVQEEIHRAAGLLMWAFVAAFAAMMALFLAALTVIFVFWDSHRVLAALSMVIVFVLIALGGALTLNARLKNKPRLLSGTLTELARDRDQLRAKP
ncbi:MAG TPA: phage holin family protein [Steroidobacteraceae bacterium]|jgi:uncharacterized membrane protein YqjE|nr:phage holin family protein [Steroidobacteraceae bacterium]